MAIPIVPLPPPGQERDYRKLFRLSIPVLTIPLLTVLGLLWFKGDNNNHTVSSSTSNKVLRNSDLGPWPRLDTAKELIFSSGWMEILAKSGNYTGIWLGCYSELCERNFSMKDYSRREMHEIVESLYKNFYRVVVNPPYPVLLKSLKFPPGKTDWKDDSAQSGNTRIPVLFAQENENPLFQPTNIVITFTDEVGRGQLSSFNMAKHMADSSNHIHNGTVTTLVYQSGFLREYSQIGDIPNTRKMLKTAWEQLKVSQGTYSYKLGLLIDRNDCVHLEQLNRLVDDILPLIDVILYRTQHDYYQYHAPSEQEGRKVKYNEQQIAQADPTPYHNAMIVDLERCEETLKGAKQNLEFLPVISCDKYWRQTFINWITHENQNLEHLATCWSLASEWAKSREKEVVFLLDLEIEKHGWFQFLKNNH